MKIFILAMFIAAATTASAQTLPSGFGTAHIGNPALAGSASITNEVFSVTGAGTDIWDRSDQFTYVYRQMTGDGVIVARVATLQHADPWSKAGIMVRESLAADAKHAFALVSGTRGVAFQRRRATGALSAHDAGGAGGAPVWLRLERRGSTFTASQSSDGRAWTAIGSDSISMASTVYVGLAITSHNAGARAIATFSDVLMPGYPAGGALPSGWTSSLIGAPGVGGSASSSGSTFTVQGIGADIWGTADQFFFVHRQLSGDGTIVARVAALQHVHQWSKAGVMIRESLAPNARHAFALVSGSQGFAYQRRRSTGGSSVHTGGGSGTAPVWLKLERRGSTFTMSRSADGVAWAVVGTDSIAMGSTVYVGLAVSSANLGAAATASFTSVSAGAVAAEAPLPAGWASADVGAPALAGSTSVSGNTFSVRAAGADIWGARDEFRFVYRQVSGDVDVITRAASLQNTDPWAKAGVMVRTSLSAGAAHASLFVSPEHGVAFQRRVSADGQSVHTSGGTGQAPVWLKLERRGGRVTAFRSSNGSSWTVIGSQTISLPSTLYVGLAVTSHNVSMAATGTFDNVIVQAASAASNQPPAVSILAPATGTTLTAPASITVSASASDPDGSVVRVDFYQGSTLIGSRTASPFSITWTNVPAGTYSLVAVARDNQGASTVSGERTVHVTDPQVPGRAVFVPSSSHATSVTNYLLEIFPSSADPRTANPVATQDLGKPPVVNGECTADVSRTLGGLSAGTYVAVVTAVGAGGTSRSAPSAPFTR